MGTKAEAHMSVVLDHLAAGGHRTERDMGLVDLRYQLVCAVGRRREELAAYCSKSPIARSSTLGTASLSSHPGTSGMGVLLTIALFYTLLSTLFFLPALLGPPAHP